MAATWDIPQVYTDFAEMIDQADLDAVVVATPNNTHYPITMRALGRGLHVLCEKPIALTYAQARDMAQTAANANLKSLVPFTYSFMPTARYLKELIDSGYIGAPYHLNMRYYTGFAREGDYICGASTNASPAAGSWATWARIFCISLSGSMAKLPRLPVASAISCRVQKPIQPALSIRSAMTAAC